jgi:hypothetical protein
VRGAERVAELRAALLAAIEADGDVEACAEALAGAMPARDPARSPELLVGPCCPEGTPPCPMSLRHACRACQVAASCLSASLTHAARRGCSHVPPKRQIGGARCVSKCRRLPGTQGRWQLLWSSGQSDFARLSARVKPVPTASVQLIGPPGGLPEGRAANVITIGGLLTIELSSGGLCVPACAQ